MLLPWCEASFGSFSSPFHDENKTKPEVQKAQRANKQPLPALVPFLQLQDQRFWAIQGKTLPRGRREGGFPEP